MMVKEPKEIYAPAFENYPELTTKKENTMSDLMKLKKAELIKIIAEKSTKITQMSIDYANKDSQYAEAEEKLNDTKLRIANIERGHEKELINKEKQITELKMQIKNDSKRFDGINSAIDTVAAIHCPSFDLDSFPDSADENDTTFSMLQHFKRLVSAESNVSCPIDRMRYPADAFKSFGDAMVKVRL